MTSAELENLVGIGTLKREPPVETELAGLKLERDERLLDDMLAATRALLWVLIEGG